MNSKKLLHLEGLRGIAALIVFFHHFGYSFLFPLESQVAEKLNSFISETFFSKIASAFFNFFVDGQIAVYIFWFMSAYVISIKLFTLNDINYVKAVILKRYVRLAIPVLASVLFAYALHQFNLMYNLRYVETSTISNEWLIRFYTFSPDFGNAIWSAFWDTFFNYDYKTTYNAVLWTMNPELYGSLFCFVLFALLQLDEKRYLGYAIVIGIVLFGFHNFWLTTFLLGFVLCDIHFTKNPLQPLLKKLQPLFSKTYIAIILLIGLILLRDFTSHPIFKVLISSGIVFLVLHTEGLQRFFENKICVWLGKVSFSFYLIHFPIICSLTCWLYIHIQLSPMANLLIIGSISLATSLLLAWLLTKYVDAFAIQLANKIGSIFYKKN